MSNIDWSSVLALEIPEGEVKAVKINGTTVWEKPSPAPELLTWEGVAYHIAAGDYATVYHVGDFVPLDLGADGVINMQIAAFDTDVKADGTGYAPITWIGQTLCLTNSHINPVRTPKVPPYTVGTGGIGGWEHSLLRDHMRTVVWPEIPASVQAMIVPVTKHQLGYTSAGAREDQPCTDTVWVPGYNEVTGSGAASGQTYYSALFSNVENRKKGKTASGKTTWATRDFYAAITNRGIGYDGDYDEIYLGTGTIDVTAPCLGFCT